MLSMSTLKVGASIKESGVIAPVGSVASSSLLRFDGAIGLRPAGNMYIREFQVDSYGMML